MLDGILILELIFLTTLSLKRDSFMTRQQRLLLYLLSAAGACSHLGNLISLQNIVKSSALFKSTQQVTMSFWFFQCFCLFACLLFLIGSNDNRKANSSALKLPVVGFLLGMWLYHPVGYAPERMLTNIFMPFGLATLLVLDKKTTLFKKLFIGSLPVVFCQATGFWEGQLVLLLTYPLLYSGIVSVFVWSKKVA